MCGLRMSRGVSLGLSAVIRRAGRFFPPVPAAGLYLVLRAGAHQGPKLSEAHAFCCEPLRCHWHGSSCGKTGWVAWLEGSHVRLVRRAWQPRQHGQRNLGASACARPAQGTGAQGTGAQGTGVKGTGAEVCSGLHPWLLQEGGLLSVVC